MKSKPSKIDKEFADICAHLVALMFAKYCENDKEKVSK